MERPVLDRQQQKMDEGSALLMLQKNLDPRLVPTLEELRAVMTQCGRDQAAGSCWPWAGGARVRFRGRQWSAQRLFYTWFSGELASNQRLVRLCDPPRPPKKKRRRAAPPPSVVVTTTEPEPNCLEIRVTETKDKKKRRKRWHSDNSCVNPAHQEARVRASDDSDCEDTTTTSSSSCCSSNSTASNERTISVEEILAMERAGWKKRELQELLGVSDRQLSAARHRLIETQ